VFYRKFIHPITENGKHHSPIKKEEFASSISKTHGLFSLSTPHFERLYAFCRPCER